MVSYRYEANTLNKRKKDQLQLEVQTDETGKTFKVKLQPPSTSKNPLTASLKKCL
jgi:hypothetical protein